MSLYSIDKIDSIDYEQLKERWEIDEEFEDGSVIMRVPVEEEDEFTDWCEDRAIACKLV